MASAGVVAEFGKKPPAVKVAIIAAIGLVLAALYWQLFYSKLRRDIEGEQAQARSLARSESELKKDEQEFKELQTKQEQLRELISENDNALPTAAELPAFFDMLNRKVGEASVEVRRWERQPEVQVDEQIFKVPVEIELQGTFYELKKFFYLLYKMNQSERDEPPVEGAPEERDRVLTIEDLRIGDAQVKNNELTLVATFRASTFRKEEPAAPAPEETGAKKATGKDATKPAAPSGELGAPQRAKDSVDRAMDKSEQRVDRVKGGM